MLRIYGHYGSQPTRTVCWLLKLKDCPFELINTNPVAGETRTNEYRSKFPLGLIPALEDTADSSNKPFYLSEASAICQYLCEKNKWDDFYPLGQDLASKQQRAKIHEYISHHNESTRAMTRKVVFPTMKHLFNSGEKTSREAQSLHPNPTDAHHFSSSKSDLQQVKSVVRDVAKRFQLKFLFDKDGSNKPYIVNDSPTIADLLAYPDLAQIPQIMDLHYSEWDELAPLCGWLGRMEKLPYHDDVHRTVMKIGKLYKSKL